MESSIINPQPPRQKSNVGLLQDLSAAVNGQAAAATFACGGSVPIVEPAAMANSSYSEPIRTCSPITLRYDAGGSASAKSRISFPLPPNPEVAQSMLDGLVKACQPATFGLEGKDVLDESYRKAAKLDASAFSTNFHPHDCGIIESVQQILLPSTITGGQTIGIGPQGARAELYKLNVASWAFSAITRVDLAVFGVFQAYGLKIGLHPIVSNNRADEPQYEHMMGGMSRGELMAANLLDTEGDPIELFLGNLRNVKKTKEEENSDEEYEDEKYPGSTTIVGTKLHGPTFDEGYEPESKKPISDDWAHEKVDGILWMNDPVHSDFAYAGMAYGNEASLTYKFSYAAILVVIPPSAARFPRVAVRTEVVR
ncbi:MAG: hypothetical protein Q9195_008390 [Heterodermia aff. obscurata]